MRLQIKESFPSVDNNELTKCYAKPSTASTDKHNLSHFLKSRLDKNIGFVFIKSPQIYNNYIIYIYINII